MPDHLYHIIKIILPGALLLLAACQSQQQPRPSALISYMQITEKIITVKCICRDDSFGRFQYN
jgi:hypothetical protein